MFESKNVKTINNRKYLVQNCEIEFHKPKSFKIKLHSRSEKEYSFMSYEIINKDLFCNALNGNRNDKVTFLESQGIKQLDILLGCVSFEIPTYAEFKNWVMANTEYRGLEYDFGQAAKSWSVKTLESSLDKANNIIMEKPITRDNLTVGEQSDLYLLSRYLENEIDSIIEKDTNYKTVLSNYNSLEYYRERTYARQEFLKTGIEKYIKKMRTDFIEKLNKRIRAQIKSLSLLKEWLSPEEYFNVIKYGTLKVPSKFYDNMYYVLHKGVTAKTTLYRRTGGGLVEEICITPMGDYDAIPEPDVLLSKYLMIKFDEEKFVKTGSHFNPQYKFEEYIKIKRNKFGLEGIEGKKGIDGIDGPRPLNNGLGRRLFYEGVHPEYADDERTAGVAPGGYPAFTREFFGDHREPEARVSLIDRLNENIHDSVMRYIWRGEYNLHEDLSLRAGSRHEEHEEHTIAHHANYHGEGFSLRHTTGDRPLQVTVANSGNNETTVIGRDGRYQGLIRALLRREITGEAFMDAYHRTEEILNRRV